MADPAGGYLWEPAPGCWSVRRRTQLTSTDSWGRGEYAVETSFDGSQEPTTTTIAWRLLHAYDCFRDCASRARPVVGLLTGTTSRFPLQPPSPHE